MTERAGNMLWSDPPTKRTKTGELQALDPRYIKLRIIVRTKNQSKFLYTYLHALVKKLHNI